MARKIPSELRARRALEDAVAIAGGQAALARAIGKRQSTIWAWLKKGAAPPNAVPAIEAATGVPRQRLRPDYWPPQETAA